jgi:hypothetical protein
VQGPEFLCKRLHQKDESLDEVPDEAHIFEITTTVHSGGVSIEICSREAQRRRWEKLQQTPWGHWSPRVHALAPWFVRHAMRIWLQIAYRINLYPDVIYLILEYICTKNKGENRWYDHWYWGIDIDKFRWQDNDTNY